MPYRFSFLKSAEVELLGVPIRHQELFLEKLTYLTRNPFKSSPGSASDKSRATPASGDPTSCNSPCSTVWKAR